MPSSSPPPATIETLVDILVADTDRLETVKYAEMGIPMFIVGETQDSRAANAAAPTDILGARLAQLATVLSLRKPELDLDDVAKLLEVLAERYFLLGTGAPMGDDPAAAFVPALDDLALPPGAPPELRGLVDGMARGRTLRLLNFHATPRYREEEFRQQIATYAKLFEPVTPANFASAVDGTWPYDRPGLLPAVFEGYRDALDVMVPILEEYGFTGWFFLPTAFLSVPPEEQRVFAEAHRLHLAEEDEYPDDRVALTWEEAREIKRRGHAFACHTRNHSELLPDTPREVLEEEIALARQEIEREVGAGADIFCWLEGAALGVNPQADRMLVDAGFRYLVSNFRIQTLGPAAAANV